RQRRYVHAVTASLAQRHTRAYAARWRGTPTLGFTRKNNHLASRKGSGTRGGVPLQYRAFAASPWGGAAADRIQFFLFFLKTKKGQSANEHSCAAGQGHRCRAAGRQTRTGHERCLVRGRSRG